MKFGARQTHPTTFRDLRGLPLNSQGTAGPLGFINGGGDMGRSIRDYDWTRTPLGAPAFWSQSLKTLVELMLASTQPMFMGWGADMTWLYNDAFVPILGRKHPAALGMPALEVWAEAKESLAPMFARVFAGEAVHRDDIELMLDRRGRLEEAHFAFSYTPARNEGGVVAGLFGVCIETTERVLAERGLLAATERQRKLFEQAPGFITVMRGPEHVFEFANHAYNRLVGNRELLGKSIREAFPELVGQGFFELLDRVYATGERYVAHQVSVRLGVAGTVPVERFLDFIYEPIVDEAGRISGIFVEGHDVTEVHFAQEALRIRERRQALMLQLNDRLRDLEDEGDLSYAVGEFLGNALGVDRAGYGTVDPMAKTITVVRDWNAPGVRSLAGTLRFLDYGSYVEDLVRGETVVFHDARNDPRTMASADALTAITARAAVNMPITEHGVLVAILFLNHGSARQWLDEDLLLLRDVAERARTVIERRRAEQGLQELAASLEQQVAERTAERDRVWRNSRDLLVVVGGDGIFRAINPAWKTILGHAPADVIGGNFRDFVWPEDTELTQGALQQAVSSVDLTNFENRYRHVDGTPRWISWRTSVEGELVYAYGRDITAEKKARDDLARAQEALRQSQKMEAVGQLTGGLAHDFNNLLAGISGSLEVIEALLVQGRLGNIERYIKMAQGSTRRAASLTQRLLAFSRRQTLDPRPTDVNRLVGGMEELIRRTVGPDVELEVVGAGGLWLTRVDSSQLENALLNLCLNARDAMAPRGGRLTIETANKWLDERAAADRELAPGQYVSLCVTDTGTGMEPDVIRRAFDPFFTTKPLGEGTGLGLSMVYGFARQSGGQVRIYSELGRGTTMCIYLPRHLGPHEMLDEQEVLDETEFGDGETVLVIEDEPTVRVLIMDLLQENGYKPLAAADGVTGLKILQSGVRIDLLITDVGLPGGMNGRQIADAARVSRPELKVLFITGYAENAAVGNGHLEPGMAILTKPFVMADLVKKVRTMISG
jgi:PAS domain S-box-containing protein